MLRLPDFKSEFARVDIGIELDDASTQAAKKVPGEWKNIGTQIARFVLNNVAATLSVGSRSVGLWPRSRTSG